MQYNALNSINFMSYRYGINDLLQIPSHLFLHHSFHHLYLPFYALFFALFFIFIVIFIFIFILSLPLQTRWAWGREDISQLEKNLAPRVIPTYCLLRVLVLCCMSWMLLILNTIAITLVPVMMGRMFFHTAQIPQRVQHDPVAYIVGACVCLTIVTVTRSFALICLNAQKAKGLMKSAVSIPFQATLKSKLLHNFLQ
jgi:hypothetical protein